MLAFASTKVLFHSSTGSAPAQLASSKKIAVIRKERVIVEVVLELMKPPDY
jgi:hypothetical protein